VLGEEGENLLALGLDVVDDEAFELGPEVVGVQGDDVFKIGRGG